MHQCSQEPRGVKRPVVCASYSIYILLIAIVALVRSTVVCLHKIVN